MSLEMILNERSLNSPAANIPTAQQWMSQLIQTIRAAQKLGVTTVRTHSDLNSAFLAADYSIAQWRNDRTVDREVQRFFKSLQTKSPFIDPLTEPELQGQANLSDFSHNEFPVIGLGVAILLNALSISLPAAPEWQEPYLQIHHSFLDPDTDEIQSQRCDCPHASQPEHLELHKSWIEERISLIPWTVTDNLLPSYTKDGTPPIETWLNALKSPQTKSIIESRLSQTKSGNLGDHKNIVGYDGILELRIFIGPGYRIYCGRISDSKLVVLWAGDKSTQNQDIAKANQYWQDWKKENGKA
jgi:putative addiction module killer protein